MKEIIIKYLNAQYHFTVKTLVDMKVTDKDNQDVSLNKVFNSLPKIFSVNEELIIECFEGWANEQAIIMCNNKQ